MIKVLIKLGKGSEVDVVANFEDATKIVQTINEMEDDDFFFTNLFYLSKKDIVSAEVVEVPDENNPN